MGYEGYALAQALDEHHKVTPPTQLGRCPVCGFLVGEVRGQWMHIATEQETPAIRSWLADAAHAADK